MRLPSPPLVSWALSGFVVGVVVTLLATGLFGHSSHSSAPPPSPTPHLVADAALNDLLQRTIQHQLGKYTDTRLPRLVKFQLQQVRSLEALSDPLPHLTRYRSIYVVFRLNDNPLGPSWRLRSAKADVFNVMKALFTSGLPVYDVLMSGLFPLKSGNTTTEAQAVVAYETHDDSSKVPWRQWGRESEGAVWNLLSYHSVDPRFG
jgi:hypothetical protein